MHLHFCSADCHTGVVLGAKDLPTKLPCNLDNNATTVHGIMHIQ
jgi:hypothetical protein